MLESVLAHSMACTASWRSRGEDRAPHSPRPTPERPAAEQACRTRASGSARLITNCAQGHSIDLGLRWLPRGLPRQPHLPSQVLEVTLGRAWPAKLHRADSEKLACLPHTAHFWLTRALFSQMPADGKACRDSNRLPKQAGCLPDAAVPQVLPRRLRGPATQEWSSSWPSAGSATGPLPHSQRCVPVSLAALRLAAPSHPELCRAWHSCPRQQLQLQPVGLWQSGRRHEMPCPRSLAQRMRRTGRMRRSRLWRTCPAALRCRTSTWTTSQVRSSKTEFCRTARWLCSRACNVVVHSTKSPRNACPQERVLSVQHEIQA